MEVVIGGVSYGDLKYVTHNGMRFITTASIAKEYFSKSPLEEIKEDFVFQHKHILDFTKFNYCPSAWAINKEDIRPLADMLSKEFIWTIVSFGARVVYRSEKGKGTFGPVTLDAFYNDLSEEEIEASRF